MSEMTNRAWAEVSLDSLAHNVRQIKSTLSDNTQMMAVVKADAYGHGVVEVSRMLVHCGASVLGVACMDEARQLRSEGILVPIMNLGYLANEDCADVVELDVCPTVFNFSVAKAISNAAMRADKRVKVHVKIDTGMNRLGYVYGEEREQRERTKDAILDLACIPNIEIEGIFSHLACADERDGRSTLKQFELFMDLVQELERSGLCIPKKHICNSAAMLRYPQMHLDMVRPGLILYGLYPSIYTKTNVALRPVMQFKTTIFNIKDVPAGEAVSYGGVYKTKGSVRVATIPIGYADGYYRLLSGKAEVLVGGKRMPIIGNICMDQCMIDITNGNNISIGDEVVLFGRDTDEFIPVEEVAKWIGTINYECLCIIGKRVPRVYTQSGAVAGVYSYLN